MGMRKVADNGNGRNCVVFSFTFSVTILKMVIMNVGIINGE
jgi:hypothetical protein